MMDSRRNVFFYQEVHWYGVCSIYQGYRTDMSYR